MVAIELITPLTRGLTFIVLLIHNFVMKSNAFTFGAAIGVVPGLALTYYLFTHNAWYHDFLVSYYSNPWLVGLAVAAGITCAVVSND